MSDPLLPNPEPTPSAPATLSRRFGPGSLFVLIAVLAGLSVASRWWARPEPVDMLPVLELNNHGVGLMEKFEYDSATKVFEKVTTTAPDWLPGRINLGIALMNQAGTPPRARAVTVFESIVRQQPGNLHAHYCLGILLFDRGDVKRALPHFQAVTGRDPGDPAAWYFLGMCQKDDHPDQAIDSFRKARKLDPQMKSVLYSLQGTLAVKEPEASARLLAEWQQFNNERIQWEYLAFVKYTEMGKYANVIPANAYPDRRTPVGPLPAFLPSNAFTVRLAPGVRWASAADFGKDAVGQLRTAVRARFGATIVVLDYNHDDKPDLFLIGAVVEKRQVRDLLLRNEGKGRFVDVTAEAGLAAPHPTLGCCVADFDNDGYPDLLLTGAGSQRLFRNNHKGGYENVTAKAGLQELKSVCLSGTFVDLDQDGDLDMLVPEFAATPEEALRALGGAKKTRGGGLRFFLNKGQAPPKKSPQENQPPLDCRFQEATDLRAVPDGPVVGLAVADLDGDRDPDLFVLRDRAPPAVLLNDRLLRFRRQDLPARGVPSVPWNGVLVFDVAHSGRSDVLVLPADRWPRVLLNRATPSKKDVGTWFKVVDTGAPVLRQAAAVDLDLDSWTDVIGLSDKGSPVLLHNRQGRLVYRKEGFGPPGHWPTDLIGLAVFPSGVPTPRGKDQSACGGIPDILVWSEAKGLQLYANQGNGNHALQVRLAGQIRVEPTGTTDRSNADGVGTLVAVQAADLWAGQEYTTLSAGLGQSRQPLVLGLGRFPKADVIRLRWPDGVVQAELGPECGVFRAVEQNRKVTSCPILFTWDGKRFVFVTDFLGAGSMGELGPDRTTRPPRPEESVKIESNQLAARDGQYVLKLAEPMDEVTYLDRLQLVALDHPADAHVYPDERFAASGPPASQELVAFRERLFPLTARDHRGRDVTKALRAWDRDTVDGFAKRAWTGFAEEHFVELDFGDLLAKFKPDDHLFMCLAGWTDYAYPESIWAAHQASIEMLPPMLERQGDDGRWHKVIEAGFPAGLPRMMLLEVTGKLAGPRCRLRLRTNLHVYWDQAFIAARCRTIPTTGKATGPDGVRATCLEVAAASLDPCGIMQEYSPDGRAPTMYDHDRHSTVLMTRLAGRMTRYGDVTELLRARDDRFVLFGPGDEVTVRFDARRLPPLPPGWKRSFVLRTWGYCKDTSLFTATGDTVEPLPFHGMRGYPYGPDQHYPRDPLHAAYRKRYNTREIKAEGSRRR